MTRSRTATSAEQSLAAHALVTSVIDLGVASTDDAHRRYELPAAVDQRAWGAITTRLLAECVLVRVGDTHTRRSVAHGRRIGRYYSPDLSRARQYADALTAAASRDRAAQLTLPGIDI